MKIVRSWPKNIPPGRAHVVDPLPRFVMDDYDYRGLLQFGDDLILIEWDVAVDSGDLQRFVDQAKAEPDAVRVAPYRLWAPTGTNTRIPDAPWAHRRYDYLDIRASLSFVHEGDPTCHLFGLGLAYLPHAVMERFAVEFPGHFSDGTFSAWHTDNVSRETPISWDVRPAHLHYPIEEMK